MPSCPTKEKESKILKLSTDFTYKVNHQELFHPKGDNQSYQQGDHEHTTAERLLLVDNLHVVELSLHGGEVFLTGRGKILVQFHLAAQDLPQLLGLHVFQVTVWHKLLNPTFLPKQMEQVCYQYCKSSITVESLEIMVA